MKQYILNKLCNLLDKINVVTLVQYNRNWHFSKFLFSAFFSSSSIKEWN